MRIGIEMTPSNICCLGSFCFQGAVGGVLESDMKLKLFVDNDKAAVSCLKIL